MLAVNMIKAATFCSGIGSPEQALKDLNVKHKIVFGCEIDPYARKTYLANFSPDEMLVDMTKEDWNEPNRYADLVVAGLPCQPFSLAGKRLGELDPRGLLFYDFYRYVKNQQPKAFIIENVKGALTDANGVTFQNWLILLGRSVNTSVTMFNHADSLEYNLHYVVLNSKNFGVPQNRERVFLVGIRPDLPNSFRFPAGVRLLSCLSDYLETDVPDKYFLSEVMLRWLNSHSDKKQSEGCGFKYAPKDPNGIANAINARVFKMGIDDNYIEVPEATKAGYARAYEGDSINFSNMGSATRRGRVASQSVDTLDTNCNKVGVVVGKRVRRLTPLECLRLQGYPDSFVKPCSDMQTYKQAGNSITTNVIGAIIKNLLPVLE